MKSSKLLERFFEAGSRFLGCRHPLICGAMTWVSDPRLVATVCNAGAFACLAGGNHAVADLAREIEETRALTDRPFGVNLITIAPAVEDHIALAERMALPYVIFAGSFPRKDQIERVKASGAKVLCFASTLSIARRMVGYGADALILEGSEAGGHVGHVSLTVLLQQVLFRFEGVPIFVAGGVATGRMCAHLLLMGAAGIQLGTRFAMAEESRAHPAFKKAFQRAKARDAVAMPELDARLPVVAVRALRNEALGAFKELQLRLMRDLDEGKIHRDDAQAQVERFWSGALRRAVLDGDVRAGSLMAGQSVGLVDRIQPAAAIVEELVGEIDDELGKVRGLLAEP